MTSLKPAQLLAFAGAFSGLLTTFVRSEAFVIKDTSVLPGLFFGLTIAYGMWRWQTKKPLILIGVVVGVIIAWIAAWNTAFHFYEHFEKILPKVQTWIFAGLLAGFVGSALTAATVHLFAPAFRERANWLRVVIFGTVAGILLAFPEMGIGEGTFALLWLFVVWQAGVAYLVAGGITGLK